MTEPSQEDLLGYVLGALDAQEQRDLQQLIDANPELDEQMLELRHAMTPLDHLGSAGSPPGLARRTVELAAGFHGPFPGSMPGDTDSAIASIEPETQDPLTRFKLREKMLHPESWSRTDVVAVVACMAVVASIMFPALAWSRDQAHIAACQDHLQQIGVAMMKYSNNNGGDFVAIPQAGKLSAAGVYAVELKESQLIEDDAVFSCAGVDVEADPVRIPPAIEITNADGVRLDELRRTMGGHYGYSMGFGSSSGYAPPRNQGLTYVALVSDRPSSDLPGRRSANHNGRGQNVLFGDGRVDFIAGQSFGDDALFENDYGVVAPGASDHDNVIAPSHLSPTSAFVPGVR